MNTQNINNMFSIRIKALTHTDSVYNAHAILQHVSNAQAAFKHQVINGLPSLTHAERAAAQDTELKARIQAVKAYRDRAGCGLGEAKSKVDSVYDAHRKKVKS